MVDYRFFQRIQPGKHSTFAGLNKPEYSGSFLFLHSMFLHIISFDIPYPANYGGVIVIFNQIKALHAQGVKVILHCYQYGDRKPQPELANYCHEIYYYKRSRSLIYQVSLLPFIMRTRLSGTLLKRLKKDRHPILFEGMHTAGLIWHPSLKSRQKLIRMHNIEWQYYESLSQLTPATAPLEKAYYFSESIKLQRIEPKVVLHADEIITISSTDEAYYRALKANTQYIPAFHPNNSVDSLSGKGEYVLFHGKLSVPDNELAAMWLIREVFTDFDIPLIIAGMSPSDRLKELVAQNDHVRLVENPDEDQMNSLLARAHINLLVSFQSSGIKLKLINALFRGRFCIVNEPMVKGTGLAKLCYVRNSAAAMRQTIEALIYAPF
ncbi:MAG TPA: mannosyltransferase [Saprospirales bacterium]|nr:mannosyltransferase [Saprospirales bacterium]